MQQNPRFRRRDACVAARAVNPVARVKLAFLVLALAFFAFVALPKAVFAGESENIRIAKALSNAYAEVVDKVGPSVVGIETERVSKTSSSSSSDRDELFERFFDQLPYDFGPRMRRRSEPSQPQRSRGIGSGVVIDRDGHILTNNHVVADADTIKVDFGDSGVTYTAEIVGTDPNMDLAIIKLVNPPADLVFAPLGDSDTLKPGNIVIAIGSPRGLKQSVTTGVVSAKGRRLGELVYERFIQTDAAINPGNSGGPLVNLDGEVIGLNTMIATRSGGSDGIGFAIPITQAKTVISQLVEKGVVTRGWLGITMNPDNPEISRTLGHDGTGALVVEVDPSGPSAKAGVRKGDLIISYDNIPVKDNEHLQYLVAETAPGRSVPLVVFRSGERVNLSIEIEPQPTDLYSRARARAGMPDRSGDANTMESSKLGVGVADIDDMMRQRYNLADTVTSGVVITNVESGSDAEDKGLRPGAVILEINQMPIKDVATFKRVLDEEVEKGKDKVLIYVRLGDVSSYMMLKLGE